MGQRHSKINKLLMHSDSETDTMEDEQMDDSTMDDCAADAAATNATVQQRKIGQVEVKTGFQDLGEAKQEKIVKCLSEMTSCLHDMHLTIQDMADGSRKQLVPVNDSPASYGASSNMTASTPATGVIHHLPGANSITSREGHPLAESLIGFSCSTLQHTPSTPVKVTPALNSNVSSSTAWNEASRAAPISHINGSDGPMKLTFYRKEDKQYSLFTPTEDGDQIYMYINHPASVLCLMKRESKHPDFSSHLSGVHDIAQRFNYVFVLLHSHLETQCIRLNMQLSDKRTLFRSHDQRSGTSFAVTNQQLLAIISHRMILELYDFNGNSMNTINLSYHSERLLGLVPLEDKCFLLHFSKSPVITKVRLHGGNVTPQWNVTSYKFQCLTVDENGLIYGVAQVKSAGLWTGRDPLCLINMDNNGKVLAVVPMSKLESEKITFVSRICVRFGFIALDCAFNGTYRFQIY